MNRGFNGLNGNRGMTMDNGMYNSVTGAGSRINNDQMLHANYNKRPGGMNTRSDNGRGNGSNDEDDYIVGPESNHSSIKKRPFRGLKRGSDQGNNQDDEHYLLM